MSEPPAAAPEVSTGDLAAAQAAGAVVIDVREPDEYEGGHVPGAVLLPISELEARVADVPADQGTVYVVCALGGRSLQAASYLRATTGVDAVSVAGGTLAWAQEGRPIVTGSAPT